MIRRLIFSGLFLLLPYQAAFAIEARELSQEEIRRVVASNNSLSPRIILDKVRKRVVGEIVDVRVFDVNGICFRVLLVLPSGKLASVVVDAATGDLLAGNSQRAKTVTKSARSTPFKKNRVASKKRSTKKATNNNGSNNSNSGSGQSNSNSGGNSSGNNGNSGGGNSGGGNGNSGGGNNSGGNSGGNSGSNGNSGGGNSGGGNGNSGGNNGGGNGNSGGKGKK